MPAKKEPIPGAMPEEALLCDLGDLFRIFGDTTRIRILYALLLEDRNVGAIAELLKMEQSAISHQLKILRNAKLVSCRRVGKTNLYSLADDHVRTILGMGFEHLTEEKGEKEG